MRFELYVEGPRGESGEPMVTGTASILIDLVSDRFLPACGTTSTCCWDLGCSFVVLL